MEENDFKALSLTGANVTPEQLDSCHHLKNETVSLSNLNVENKDKMFFLIEKI